MCTIRHNGLEYDNKRMRETTFQPYSRFLLEPSGTMCTIDFWHGNVRNYHAYMAVLVVAGYALPILLT